MKEIVNVSISGIAFTLDKECYAMLNNFLQTTERERGVVVCSEVEASIAEQILSVQSSDKPVSMSLLREILERIGGVDLSSSSGVSGEGGVPRSKVAKRLYRKGEGSVLGGVCNGLATYFNVHVALIRVLFLVPFIFSFTFSIWHMHSYWHFWPGFGNGFSGTMFMLYIILWIVIPKARSARQILEMEGEDITVSSLERTSSQAGYTGSVGCTNHSRAGGTILRILGLFFGGFVMFSSVAGVIAMLFGTQFAHSNNPEAFNQLFNLTGLTLGWFQLWLGAVIMLPSIGIFYLIVASAFGRVRGWIAGLIFGLWVLLLIAAAVWIAMYAPELVQLDGRYHFNWDWD